MLKVAHHGSVDPGLDEQLRVLRPQVAVISAGRNNDYGHPRPETLAALAAVPGLALYRTDTHGRVIVESDGRRIRVRRRLAKVPAVAELPDKPVYLLTGSDRPKIDTALARLRAPLRAGGDRARECARHVGRRPRSPCATPEACSAMRGSSSSRASTGGATRTAASKGAGRPRDIDVISAYLASPAPATVLALVGEDVGKTTALWKALREGGRRPRVCRGEEGDSGLGRRAVSRSAVSKPSRRPVRCSSSSSAGKTCTRSRGRSTSSRPGPRASRSASARSSSCARPLAEVPIFALTDAWAARDAARTLEASETILERESKPRRDTAARLAGALGRHLEPPAARSSGSRGEGVRSKEAAESSG